MSIFRIIKKNLVFSGQMQRITAHHYRDLRPRDEFGCLLDYCSNVEKERREKRDKNSRI
jgi:hypothetical protein